MSQLKTDEDSLDWRRKTWTNRKTFSVGRKQTGIHSRALNEITSQLRSWSPTAKERPTSPRAE